MYLYVGMVIIVRINKYVNRDVTETSYAFFFDNRLVATSDETVCSKQGVLKTCFFFAKK